jgi:hypothetical protein
MNPDPTSATAAAQTGRPTVIAYHFGREPQARLSAASVTRDWILNTHGRFAQRCLPLLIANQSGWTLHNPEPFRVTWDGNDGQLGIRVEGMDGRGAPAHVSSLFGYGILSWTVPYLFRTSPGYNLLARGPANLPKDGIGALEGVVETDWAVASFTMNWKFTRPGSVEFERDEPYCMLVPQKRGEIESFQPTTMPLSGNAELEAQHRAWDESRKLSILMKRAAVALQGPEHPDALKWEGHYFRGTSPGGATASEHQTKLNVPEFEPG